jgi:hypothetical protein
MIYEVSEYERNYHMRSMRLCECIKYASDFEYGEIISTIMTMYHSPKIVSFASD